VVEPPRDPYNPFDDRAVSRAMLFTIVVFAATGAGVGVFFEQPAIGAIIGGAAGILLAALLVPKLMRDWRD
jgi:hypothetical protein